MAAVVSSPVRIFGFASVGFCASPVGIGNCWYGVRPAISRQPSAVSRRRRLGPGLSLTYRIDKEIGPNPDVNRTQSQCTGACAGAQPEPTNRTGSDRVLPADPNHYRASVFAGAQRVGPHADERRGRHDPHAPPDHRGVARAGAQAPRRVRVVRVLGSDYARL